MAKFCVNTISEETKIFEALVAVSNQFDEALFADTGAIKAYAHKLYDKGNVLGAYYNDNLVGVLAYYYNEYSVDNMGFVPLLSLVSSIGTQGFVRAKAMSCLLFEIRDQLIQKGASGIMLEVNKNNEHAINIYKRLGAVIEGNSGDNSMYMKIEWDNIPY